MYHSFVGSGIEQLELSLDPDTAMPPRMNH